jgi:short-subunit dehydrogenase
VVTDARESTILLTGASGAIGSEVAKALTARGARMVLSGRRRGELDLLAAEIAAQGGPAPIVLPADLSRPGEAAGLAERAVMEAGRVDVLINNAGASMQGLAWVVGDRDAARVVFEVNLWSPLALIAALVPPMVERGHGAVVNVGSMARVSPFPHLGIYSASRAALAAATQVLDLELGPRGVRVVEVALGPVDTPASRDNRALAGAEAWLDGRPGLGDAGSAAAAIAAASLDSARGARFYPRSLRWVDRLPGLGRRYSRRVARGADLVDETIG